MRDIIHFPKCLELFIFTGQGWGGSSPAGPLTSTESRPYVLSQKGCGVQEAVRGSAKASRLLKHEEVSGVCSSIFLFTLWMLWDPIWSVTYSAGWAGGGPAGMSFWLMSLMSWVRHLQWKVPRLYSQTHLSQILALPSSCCVTIEQSLYSLGLSPLICTYL